MDHEPRLLFLTLAEERDLKRAALRWGVTQRQIRSAVSKLEAEYGAPLCVIQTKKAALTEAGERLWRSLVLAGVEDDIFRVINVMQDAMSEHGVGEWISRAAHQACPFTKIELSKGNLRQQIGSLDLGTIDIALLYGWPPREDSEFTFMKLLDQEMSAFLSREAQTAPGTISFSSLCRRTWILPTPSVIPRIGDLLSWECRKDGFVPYTRSTHLKSHFLEAIRSREAVGYAPSNFIRNLPPGIIRVPLKRHTTVPFGCLHRAHEASTSVHRFLNLMRQSSNVESAGTDQPAIGRASLLPRLSPAPEEHPSLTFASG